jgi:hypothetical protein
VLVLVVLVLVLLLVVLVSGAGALLGFLALRSQPLPGGCPLLPRAPDLVYTARLQAVCSLMAGRWPLASRVVEAGKFCVDRCTPLIAHTCCPACRRRNRPPPHVTKMCPVITITVRIPLPRYRHTVEPPQ